MDLQEFLQSIREPLQAITQLLKQGEKQKAFELYKEKIGVVNGFIMFMDENDILQKSDLQKLVEMLLQALENEDAFLLNDILEYGLLDIIKQLGGE